MTNMSNDKLSKWDTVHFGFIPAKYFMLFLLITVVGVAFNATPQGFLGGFLICTVFGLLLDKIGEVTPFVRSYLGGGSLVAIFGAAVIMYFGLFPKGTTTLITDFIKPMDYLGWVVGALICGSILTMDRKLLIKAGALYFIPILCGIVLAFGLTGAVGQMMGYGWKKAILFIALPIMGGGTAAGAVPTAQIYAGALSNNNTYYLSLIMPAVVIGNALAIVSAGIMKSIGNKFPKTTGNGKLMRDGALAKEEKKEKKAPDLAAMGRGFIITGIFFTIGILINKLVPSIHYYAWTIIACALCNITGIFPEKLQEDVAQWYNFAMKLTIPAVLFGIGFVYTDLGVIIANLNVTYLILVLTTLIGAIVATWIVGGLLGFYPVECAITAGLCMANMGGSGDIATLGAADRMELMPFAQISSRIGGAIIIVLASILAPLLGAGL